MTSFDTPTGWVRRLVAVILAMMATTAALVGAPAPAGAAACSSASGVSVVVDFGSASGGLQSVCVAAGADRPADEVIAAAGFTLTWVIQQPGFICRVDGVPADDPCVNTPPPDAYWGLFWSDGKDGAWHYSDIGASGLQVPDGGYIGVAWQTGTRREPGLTPTVHPVETPTTAPTTTEPSPTFPTTSGTTEPTNQPTKTTTQPTTTQPTTQPTTHPTTQPTSKSTEPVPTTTSSNTETRSSSPSDPTSSTSSSSESPTAGPGPPSSGTQSPTDSATADPSEPPTEPSTATPTETPSDATTTPTEPQAAEESNRVPTWLTVMILVMLLTAIGMSTVAARRQTHN